MASREEQAPPSPPSKKDEKPPPALPQPTLPKGGGAIAPIGEKFVANAHMGTADFSIPVFTSSGRAGFGPKLTLSYSGGTGNGPYGVGWSLSVPNISRRTEKGLPTYNDTSESDVFVLSGAEDLVPISTSTLNGETIVRYRPRVEAAYARIERHVRGDGTQYWVAWARDNVRSVYGYTAQAQIADPDHPNFVFRWLLEWTDDDRGNVIAYVYKAEDNVNVASTLPELNRARNNRYLKAVAYANALPRASRDLPPLDLSGGRAAALASWPLVALFDYGEHDATNPTLTEGNWPARQDPFSSYRSGFELRTHRLCRRILMLHKFDPLGPDHVVVRSTELGYKQTPAITYLVSATQVGWQKNQTGGYDTKAMPSIAMGYGEVGALDQTLHVLDKESARNLPDGIAGAYSFLDYDGEGLPGVLSEEAGRGWFYKRPEGRDDDGAGHFGRTRRLDPRPNAALAEGFQLQDINADGLLDLVRVGKRPEGAFERVDSDWNSFRAFPASPHIDWNNPNLRFLDLDGDGFPDVLIADQDVFRWHRALGRDGYAGEQRTSKPLDRIGPVPLFATEREAVLLADMTGDGLSDIVHVQSGSVCYWPNLGYGRFGARVQMANAPRLDSPEGFDPRRVRMGDVDGTGTSDLVYVRGDGVHVFLNQAGNSFAAQPPIRNLPPVHDFAHFTITDLFGTGTACLVWSSPLPHERERPLRWIDLLDGHKPHLIETVDNGLGTKSTIAHAPSTKFYLQDRAAGLPWITKLPFPVQVIESVTVEDTVSETKVVSAYRYHHGFYDGVEREFRGFGMVEQRDTQNVAQFYGSGEFTRGLDQTLHIPPAVVKTWFHTGAYIDASKVSRQLAHEYWAGDTQLVPLADSLLSAGLTPGELREAYRALRGQALRQETYAEDGDPAAANPYIVDESNFTVELLHPRGEDRYAVFAVHARETVQLHYERNPTDPRIEHHLTIATSPYGDVVDEVEIAYPRRINIVTPAQSHLWATWTHHTLRDLDGLPADYRVGIPIEEVTAELAALTASSLLQFADVAAFIKNATVGDYNPARRPLLDPAPPDPVLMHRSRHYYWDDTLTQRLQLGTVQPRALPYESLTLALNANCLQVLSARATANETANATLVDPQQAGYASEDGLYWSTSGVVSYDDKRFYQPISLRNPFGGLATVDYDPALALLAISTTDPAGLTQTFEPDWRLLNPAATTDPNGTRSEVTYDTLGVVVAVAVRGVAGEGGPTVAMDYAFYSSPDLPTFVHVRTFPDYDPNGAIIEESYVYSDGLGREVMKKVRAEDGAVVDGGPIVSPRWVGTGRTVFNNKALPVKKYEPYFSDNSRYETEAAIVMQGVTAILQYDPLGRVIRIDHPNATFSQVAFDAWSRTSSDENDTVLESGWYLDRTKNGTTASAREQDAAKKAAAHARTPKVKHQDALGHVVLVVDDNLFETHETLFDLDISGDVLSVVDAENKRVMTSQFDLARKPIFSDSADAGRTWRLFDAGGEALFAFRAQGAPDGYRVRVVRDVARRPTQTWVWKDGDPPTSETLRERIVYGPAVAGPPLTHGHISHEFDGAGLVTYAYDFRGGPVQTGRRLAVDYRSEPDWSAVATFDGLGALPVAIDLALQPLQTTAAAYDAARRPKQVTTPDGSITNNTYNVAGLLERVDVTLGRRAPGPNQTVAFVENIDYDAKGRRSLIERGNGVTTSYHYDPETLRLNQITSTGPGGTLQDLSYVYDPVGNITSSADAAQPTVCFANQMVRAAGDYTYDALYQLTIATGREHPTQAGLDQRDVPQPLPLPTDCAAIVNYQETYQYSKGGNLSQLAHTAYLSTGPITTTRGYNYDGVTNRLQSTVIGIDQSSYSHNARGDMTAMPHLDAMAWNHRDELIGATRTRVGNGPNVATLPQVSNPVFFAYDLRGQRVRKVSENGNTVADRAYLGSYELYREYPQGGVPTLQRDSLHVTAGERVALVETLTDGTQELLRYSLADHLGSATLELDGRAGLLSYEEFHPYGTTAFFIQGVGTLAKRYRFTGKERDEETGLDYHGARYCAPWLGRWTSVDPKGFKDGTSGYAYVRNNPIAYADPKGEEAKKPSLAQSKANFIDMLVDKGRVEHGRAKAAQQKAADVKKMLPPAPPRAPLAPQTFPNLEFRAELFKHFEDPNKFAFIKYAASAVIILAAVVSAGVALGPGGFSAIGRSLVGEWQLWSPTLQRGAWWAFTHPGSTGLLTFAGLKLLGVDPPPVFGFPGSGMEIPSLEMAGLVEGGANALSKSGGASYDLALGLSRSMEHNPGLIGRFAAALQRLGINAQTYWDFYPGSRVPTEGQLLGLMRGAEKIRFNLSGMLNEYFPTVESLIQSGRQGLAQGNSTNWELYQALSRFADKTVLYLNGGEVTLQQLAQMGH